jgi:phage terminase large subunit
LEAKTLRLSELINPTERQRGFLQAADKFKYLLYGGAAGGGKSYILRWAALLKLIKIHKLHGIRNAKFGLFCEDYPSLTDRQVSKIAAEFPAELGEIKKSQTEGLAFKLREGLGGGLLLLRNLDDPSKYNSTEFVGIGVDELTRNRQEVFDELRKRLRWPGLPDDYLFSFWGTTNPGGIGHGWVKRYWIDRDFPPELKDVAEQFHFIQAKAQDNPHNPASYYSDLQTLPEMMRRAYAEGDWDLFAGQFFTEFRKERHVVEPFRIPDYWQKWCAADWGFANPACNLWFARSPEGKTYVYRESYLKHVSTKDLGKTWAELSHGESMRYKVLDTACWDASRGVSIADEMSEVGWTCVKADKGRANGWSRVRGALKWTEEKTPELQIFRTCGNLIRTLPTMVFDEHNLEDLDSDAEDHAVDALRYGLMPPIIESKLPDELLRPEMREAQDRADKWVNR